MCWEDKHLVNCNIVSTTIDESMDYGCKDRRGKKSPDGFQADSNMSVSNVRGARRTTGRYPLWRRLRRLTGPTSK